MKQVLNLGLANFNTQISYFQCQKKPVKIIWKGKKDPALYIITASLHSIMNIAMKGDSNITFVQDRKKKSYLWG